MKAICPESSRCPDRAYCQHGVVHEFCHTGSGETVSFPIVPIITLLFPATPCTSPCLVMQDSTTGCVTENDLLFHALVMG